MGSAGIVAPILNVRANDTASMPKYRALVCIGLGGGADSFNMLVPTGRRSYQNYIERRGNLALDHNELLQLSGAVNAGDSYALHYGLQELHQLYAAGDVALVANVGAPQFPQGKISRARNTSPSHAELIARWQLGTTDLLARNGWAGRFADLAANYGWQDHRQTNISMTGRNLMQLGRYSVATAFPAKSHQPQVSSPAGVDFSYVGEQLVERALERERSWSFRRKLHLMEEAETDSLKIVEDAITDVPRFTNPFSADSFSADLERVAKVISVREKLGVRRQIFYVHFNGWDHHHQLLDSQAKMLPILSQGLAAFRDALIEHNVFDDVATFTISEFGRALGSNGSGSDHGWGGHQFAMGGGINGGKIFGEYPDIAKDSPLDIGDGSFVPTTSVDEYLAEMLLWLGTPLSDLDYVLPNIYKFWNPANRHAPIGLFA